MTHTAMNRYSFNRPALSRSLLAAAGVLLSTVTLTAMASPSNGERFAECRDLARAYYGDDTRVRLYNIRNRVGFTELRLRVNPAEAHGTNLLCTAAADGDAVLRTRDGVAIAPPTSAPIAFAER